MPQAAGLLPALFAFITEQAITTGFGGSNQTGGTPPAPPKPTAPQTALNNPNEAAAVSQSSANTQAQTGQGLSPGASAALIDQLYKTPGGT
jgi:hypothetical protein